MSVRVHILAKEINMDPKELAELLRKEGHDIKTTSSVVSTIYADEYRQRYGAKTASEGPTTSTPEAPVVAAPLPVTSPPVFEVASAPPVQVAPPLEVAPPPPAAPTVTASNAAPAPAAPPRVAPSVAAPPRLAPPGVSRAPMAAPAGVRPAWAVVPQGAATTGVALVKTAADLDREKRDKEAAAAANRPSALVAPPGQGLVRPTVRPTGSAVVAPPGVRPPAVVAPPGGVRPPPAGGPPGIRPAPAAPAPVAKGPPPVVQPPRAAPSNVPEILAPSSPPPPAPPLPRAASPVAPPPVGPPATPPIAGGSRPPMAGGPPALPPRAQAAPAVGPRNVAPPPAAPTAPATVEATGPLKPLAMKPPIIVRDFAMAIGAKPFRLISELLEMGIFASMNQPIDVEVAAKVAARRGFVLEVKQRGDAATQQAKRAEAKTKPDPVKFTEIRPPVVCILGHVDHGKTTLLDTIRQANVAAGEPGGITQHIGAYQIEHAGKKITFIDTPGHAAFANMRARGANSTDIAVLVVAADDGFMPQTDEALGHARRAGIAIVVAINKMDTKGANIDRVKKQLQDRNLTPEDWGGETLAVPVSALKGTNVPDLLDAILLQAEIMDTLRANPKLPSEGIIIEAQKEVGRGSTASVIVQNGTLKVGDAIVCGPHYCKVRSLVDDRGKAVKAAPPSMPVKVIGWNSTPDAGMQFRVVANEKEAKAMAEEAELELKKRTLEKQRDDEVRPVSAADLISLIEQEKAKIYRVLVKADVYGTAEALAAALEQIKSTKITLEVVDMGVGPISKNDVVMASASEAAVVAFDVGLDTGVGPIAKHMGVRVIEHNIIYELIDQVKEAMAEQLEPELREVKLGMAEVRQVFPVSKGFVAGCLVTQGIINRDGRARLLRKNRVEHEGRVSTLRRFKDDANEVRAGYECGIRLDGYDAYQPGDIIESFDIQKIKANL